MNNVLLPAATPSNSATVSSGSSRAALDNSAPDQASDFAGVLASQAMSQPQKSGNTPAASETDPQTRTQGTPRQGDATNGDDTARSAPHVRPTQTDNALINARGQREDVVTARLHAGRDSVLATDAKTGLPERFSQIIAAMATVNGTKTGNSGASENGTGKTATEQDLALSGHPIQAHDSRHSSKHHTTHFGAHQHSHTTRLASRTEIAIDAQHALAHDTLTTGMPARGTDPIAFNLVKLQHDVSEHSSSHTFHNTTAAIEPSASASFTPAAAFSLIPSPIQSGDVTIPSATISQPLHTQHWAPELGRQFISLIRPGENGNHIAELRLDPPELGPLRVTINLNDSVVQAQFMSSHATVRNAVESALPQLQQQLEQEGLSLGHASVDHDDSSSDTRAQHGGTDTGRNRDESSVATTLSPVRQRASDALVDTFA